MRREALEQTDLYDPRLPHSGDLDMWLRTAARWDVGRVNGPQQALYRVHDANMHLTTYAGWVTDLRERRRTFDILVDERAPGVAFVESLRPMAYRALAREAVRRARAAGLERPGAPEVAELIEFAEETWPGVRRPQGTPSQTGVGSFTRKVRHHLLWRRERRYGF